jgi:hypothetical protein
MEDLQKQFFAFRKNEIEKIRNDYEKFKKDKNSRLVKDYVKKFPFLKKKSPFPSFMEVLKWKSTNDKFDFETQLKPLRDMYISKITGIFKHGQTMKTALCNLRIVSNVKLGKITMAISKNTLNAKEQWEERLIKELKEEFHNTPLNKMIIVISSKKNDLNGNATHCKNIGQAMEYISDGNFKIIFVCSNNKRIDDLIKLVKFYGNLAIEKQHPIDIIQDEAHNNEEGIPSKREAVEELILNPLVETFIPVSASPDPIFHENEPLWNRNNMERNAIDYTKFCQVISTSPNYSSIAKAKKLSFERLQEDPNYRNYDIAEFTEELFEEAEQGDYYKNTKMNVEEIKLDKERRRQLEFCSFLKYEKQAMSYGMNILDNYYMYNYQDNNSTISTPFILSGVFNVHLITTPLRVVFTITLMDYALKQEYNPICIGIYRSGIHIRYKNKLSEIKSLRFCDFDEKNGNSEEMNEKIYQIIKKLKDLGEDIERPFILFGNYDATGESITFVNYKYGAIRANVLLPGAKTTREDNYQTALRGCYMDTKFKEKNPDFVQPIKFLIASQKAIDDAITYEQENDKRVSSLKDGTYTELYPPTPIRDYYEEDDNNGISVPIEITILDIESEPWKNIRKIMNSSRRTAEQKQEVLDEIHNLVEKGDAKMEDYTRKFDFENYTLKDIRTYKNKNIKQNYRFENYHSAFKTHLPYINNKGKMEPFHCEILAAYDIYEFNNFKNHKTVMWLSYRYE